MGRAIWQVLIPLVAMIVAPIHVAVAQQISDDPRINDVWKKSQVLRDQPSIDATPILFSVGNVHYSVPRNYISKMDNYKGGPQELVVFKATFPGFEPLTDETKQCLTQPQAYWPPGCIPLEFWIGAQGKDMPVISDESIFKSSLDLFVDKTPKKGPNGFDLYQYGPDTKALRLYTKKTSWHRLVLLCRDYEMSTKVVGLCTNYDSLLDNGNGLSYRLYTDQVPNAESIDDGIRSLIDSFTVKGEKP